MNWLPTVSSSGFSVKLRRFNEADSEHHQHGPFLMGQQGYPLRNVPSPKKILSIGDDEMLLFTRHMVLESAGFFVHSASSHEATFIKELRGIDLVLICHSVERDRAARITDTLKCERPSLSVMLLSSGYGAPLGAVEQIASFGPQKLLSEVTQILQGSSF